MSPRQATPSDVPQIEAVVASAYAKYVPRIGRQPKPMTADYRAAVAEHQVWVCEDGGELVAVLELIPGDGHLLIENIAVRPSRQGRGIGRDLLRFAEEEAIRQGCRELRLYTNARFTENLAIYAKAGYRESRRELVGATEVVHMAKTVAPDLPQQMTV